ncbi:hypothetical protein AMTR_s00004p00167380 [Amborella trichopoda]|uniref:Uncharacterized protein n=1 Tax=Amborella trichopoda TaxID=13333 RepID=W1NE69_AMBTC|nr:hypothetical protein AMTR_s00004p00167380 [Amborella trichopoda]
MEHCQGKGSTFEQKSARENMGVDGFGLFVTMRTRVVDSSRFGRGSTVAGKHLWTISGELDTKECNMDDKHQRLDDRGIRQLQYCRAKQKTSTTGH